MKKLILPLSLFLSLAAFADADRKAEQEKDAFCRGLVQQVMGSQPLAVDMVRELMKGTKSLNETNNLILDSVYSHLNRYARLKGSTTEQIVKRCETLYKKEAGQVSLAASVSEARQEKEGDVRASMATPTRKNRKEVQLPQVNYGECKQNLTPDGKPCLDEVTKTTTSAFSSFFEFFNFMGGSNSDCNCIKNLVSKKYQGNEDVLSADEDEMKDEIRETALTEFGKKFLNDYSANLEDVNFYATKVATVFGKTKDDQKKKVEALQCSDVNQFELAFRSQCRDLPDEQIQKRIDMFLGVYGGAREATSLKDHLQRINEKIVLIEVKDSKGQPKRYSRESFDEARYSLSLTDKQYKLMDRLVLKAISDYEVKNSLEMGLPLDIISKKLLEDARKEPDVFISTYLMDVDSDVRKKFSDYIKSNDNNEDNNIFNVALREAMGLHPGFESLLRDGELLKKVAEKANPKEESPLTKVVEAIDSPITKKIEERCTSLKRNLAKAVCMSNQQIMQNISKKDAATLIKPTAEEGLLFLKLMCESNGKDNTNAPFVNITMENRADKLSDFTAKMKNGNNAGGKVIQKIETDNAAREKVKESLAQTQNQGSSVIGATALASSMFGSESDKMAESLASLVGFEPIKSDAQMHSSSVMESLGPVKAESTLAGIAGTEPATPADVRAAYADDMVYSNLGYAGAAASTASAIVPPFAAPSTSDSKTTADLKREMRDFLADESNKDQVDRLVSGADEATLRELQKIREEYAKNQQTLTDLQAQNERLRLQMMEQDRAKLEQRREQVVSQSTDDKDETPTRTRTPSQNYLGDVGRDIASVQSRVADTGGSTSGQQSSSQTSGSERASLSSPVSAASSAAAANQAKYNMDSTEPVVFSGGKTLTVSEDIKSQDLNLEVLNYLEKSSPDVNSLLKLKNSGMLYKYQVMENGVYVEKEMLIDYKNLNANVRKIIDEKLSKSGVDAKTVAKIDAQIKKLKREHTYSSLKLILAEKMRK